MDRKKIRGWPGKLRRLDRLRDKHLELDLDALLTEELAYVKLWIDPFYRLDKRNPPMWYRKRCVSALVAIHDAWARRLATLDQPSYLALWLYHPNFLGSQVVAAVGSHIAWYERLFPSGGPVRPTPLPDFDAPDVDLASWSWSAHPELFPDDIAPHERHRAWARSLMRRAVASRTDEHGVLHVLVRHGSVWVGRRAPPAAR